MMPEESSVERSVNSGGHLRRRDAHDDEGEEADQRGVTATIAIRRDAPRPFRKANQTLQNRIRP